MKKSLNPFLIRAMVLTTPLFLCRHQLRLNPFLIRAMVLTGNGAIGTHYRVVLIPS